MLNAALTSQFNAADPDVEDIRSRTRGISARSPAPCRISLMDWHPPVTTVLHADKSALDMQPTEKTGVRESFVGPARLFGQSVRRISPHPVHLDGRVQESHTQRRLNGGRRQRRWPPLSQRCVDVIRYIAWPPLPSCMATTRSATECIWWLLGEPQILGSKLISWRSDGNVNHVMLHKK